MLERIRAALGRPPRARGDARLAGDSEPSGALMPHIPCEEVLPRFEAEWKKVGGSTYRAPNLDELEKIIGTILERSQAMSVVLSRNPLLGQLRLKAKLEGWGKSVTIWPSAGNTATKDLSASQREFAQASFSSAVGITGVDFALAETGSLILSSRTEGSQLASLAPPVHVALYRRNQTIGSLDEVLEKLPVSREPKAPTPGRSVVFITGPSRTADIEQILILGVHGPREVHAILVEESCLVREGGGVP